MNANEIVQKAKERLAEIDAESAKLRAIIAAAEGATTPVLPPPSFIPVPLVIPASTPWWGIGEVTCGGILPEPDGTVYGPGPSIDNSTRYGAS